VNGITSQKQSSLDVLVAAFSAVIIASDNNDNLFKLNLSVPNAEKIIPKLKPNILRKVGEKLFPDNKMNKMKKLIYNGNFSEKVNKRNKPTLFLKAVKLNLRF
jgi:hypothetical protein